MYILSTGEVSSGKVSLSLFWDIIRNVVDFHRFLKKNDI